jgi:hypothetical protein
VPACFDKPSFSTCVGCQTAHLQKSACSLRLIPAATSPLLLSSHLFPKQGPWSDGVSFINLQAALCHLFAFFTFSPLLSPALCSPLQGQCFHLCSLLQLRSLQTRARLHHSLRHISAQDEHSTTLQYLPEAAELQRCFTFAHAHCQ